MESVVLDIVESKKDEIVVDEKKVDDVLDKVEDVAEKIADDVSKKVEEVAKPLTDLIDKLDDIPQIAKAIDILEDQLDGREVSCSCFGWLVALRIARKSKQTPPTKPVDESKTTVVLPSPDSPAKESPPPKTPQSE